MSDASVSGGIERRASRGFLGGILVGVVVGALFAHHHWALADDKPADKPAKKPVEIPVKGRPWQHPSDILASISKRKKQIWVVSYVGQPVEGGKALDGTFADCQASIDGGADAVLLVNENMPEGAKKTQFPKLPELEEAIKAVRAKFPDLKVGVNWLGDDEDPYGFRHGFRLAKENGLSVVWTDVSGIDLIKQAKPESLHEIANTRPPGVFYCSGIHMKYTTLLDPDKTIEESALQAMGWVDGVIVTGPKTGVASDPGQVKRARDVMGPRYPLGVASGVTAENVTAIRDQIDFVIVHTGIQEKHRIVAAKVKALRAALDGE